MARQYSFDLPYTISSFMLQMGWGQIRNDPLFMQLTPSLQYKLEKAHSSDNDVSITKQDCDSLDDKTWSEMATKLNLAWSGSNDVQIATPKEPENEESNDSDIPDFSNDIPDVDENEK